MYRHPNTNIDHFVDSMEHTLSNIKDSVMYMAEREININLKNT